MKKLLTLSALTCALCLPAMAGQIPTVGSPDTPALTASSSSTSDAPPSPGDIPISGVAEEISTDALSALLSVFGFLAR